MGKQLVNKRHICRGEPIGTVGATYGAGIYMEELALAGMDYCGGAADMAKYFDQIPKETVYLLARAAGMPTRVLETYKKSKKN